MSKIRILLFCVATLFATQGCEKITDTVIFPPTTDLVDTIQPLTVMTYNVYVGSSTDDLLSVDSLLEVPTEVAKIYHNAIASDFLARAVAIATHIETHHPHLIGLQEISVVRRQSPGDLISGGTVLAENVEMDYLHILLDAIHAVGLQYQVAAKVENFDVEMPMFTETGIDDIRLTDYDVILARHDVETADATAATYDAAFRVDLLGLDVKRGYVGVDATVDGNTYRFVNTHLGSYSEDARIVQTQELINSLADETLPIILLGDFNTPAPDGTAYQMLRTAGYIDLYQADPHGNGNTCCLAPDLRNETSALSERIDLIFLCHPQGEVSAITHTVGDKAEDRLPNRNLWPSDHAGVVAEITFQ
ncbi:MAG: endonuclease/exonuclease/phosphatase family protein [Candidatus Poribacteria bacterium]|nr:endonuclease/exonuclease/phosphatase family protein [Candidatus Poribacteria bacterium]